MAPRKYKSKSKRPAKKAVGKRRAPRRARNNVSDMASCSVVRTLADVYVNNNMYSFDSFTLADHPRAVAIAQNYQRYRITGIRVTWKPLFDTYSPATANQKPNLYYMIDKNGSIPDTVTLEGLKQAGARAHRFDEGPKSVTFKPAVLGEARINAGIPQAATYVVSPWLSTAQNPTAPGAWNPSEVSHQGIKWYIEQGGASQKVYVEIELQFQFIKPLFPTLSAMPAVGLQYAVLDNSPDGVEGGTDGQTIHLTSPSLA